MKNANAYHRWTAGFVAALLWLPLSATAETVMHGRISFDAGGTLLKGAEEADWSNGTVNTLVLAGDTLWVDNGGTTEVEFAAGSFLRMADGSKAEIQSMPPSTTIRGWTGSFYVQRLSRSSGDFVFYTPAGIVEVQNDSSVRIDILDDGVTTVSTRWGRASVRTDAGGSVLAHSGRRVYVEPGLLPSQPTPYDRSDEDAFDQWNRERAEFLATGSTQVPSQVQISDNTIGVSDLNRYGEWLYIDNRPCWRPTVVVDYTPYRYGYWNHVGRVGSVWVGNYPFSYVTSHHGYWDYHGRYGWVWSYTPTWSPAYCATVRYGDYFVWAPVNRYYRPVYPTTTAHFSIGGVSFGYWGSSYVHVDNLYHGPRYVNYAYNDTFRRYYGRDNVTINIWNINTGSRPHVRVPYNDSVTTVRDYTPRRRIRGASSLDASGIVASSRVQRLESSAGRAEFSTARRTGGDFVRTSTPSRSSSRVRTARISQDTPDYARASRGNPVRATSDTARSRATTRGLESTSPVATRTPSSRSTTGRTEESRGRISRGTTSRSTDRSTSRSTTPPQRTDIDPRSSGSDFNARTPVTTYRSTPSRTTSPERTETARRTPDRSVSRPSTTPSSAAESSRTRTTAPRSVEAPSGSRFDSGRSSRTQTRAPQATTSTPPSRSYAEPRNTRTTSPRPQVSSTPSRSTNSRPQVSSTPSRSTSSRPQVTTRPTAPSRQVSPPSRSTSSRSLSSAPSRQSSVRTPSTSSSSRSTAGRAPSSRSTSGLSSSRSRSTSPGNSGRGR